MTIQTLAFENSSRHWSDEREAVIFFARSSGAEYEFIVTKEALVSVGKLASSLNEDSALLTFDNYEDVFRQAATRVWVESEGSKPAYFITADDLARV